MQPASAFCHSAKALCVCCPNFLFCESYLVLSVLPLYKLHIRSIFIFLQKSLEGADCVHCEHLPMHSLRSRKALFDDKGAFTSVSRGAGPAAAEAERHQHSWGSQVDLLERMETGGSLSPSPPIRFSGRSPRRKPARRLLLHGERTQRFSYLPLRRVSARAPRLCPLCHPSMRSCWRWWLVLWPN